MLVALYASLAVAVLVIAVAFAVLVSGLLRTIRKVEQTCEDLSGLVKATEGELTETTQCARDTMADVDRLVIEVTGTVSHVDRAACGVERIVDTIETATTAVRLARSSTGGLLSVYEGVKQGIRSLWGPNGNDKEGTTR